MNFQKPSINLITLHTFHTCPSSLNHTLHYEYHLAPLAIVEKDNTKSSETKILSVPGIALNLTQPTVPETWSIDGGEPACFRFHAIPHFAQNRAPLQISVIVPLDQMTLIHIRDHGPGFYSDLKPNNVLLVKPTGPHVGFNVMDDSGLTAPLIIDFEQRGSWYGWSPPKVQYVEYLDMLATKSLSNFGSQEIQRYTAAVNIVMVTKNQQPTATSTEHKSRWL
ncbi:hypothetical protein QBC36DRAFT_355502 [Triangularia setosa]|uniref:Protein kinase domain-containing protein n=1 Tax=Triangularia setosa TaxID=2587417 RepID=A0AAN7A6I6_9PEZI|nr:hypothetical protein QBC36DRAFT_355502 [Podospora setosa]